MSVTVFHRVLVFSLLALVVLYADMILFNPVANKTPNMTIFLLHALPLLVCLGLIIKQNYRGFIWVCFISLMFFCVAVANIFSGYGWVNYLEIVLSVVIFSAALLAAMRYKTSSQ